MIVFQRHWLFTSLVIASSFLFISSAHAESVLWNHNAGTLRYAINHQGWRVILNAQMSVLYAIRVLDANTGAVIAPNAEVPTGTKVRFEFKPHERPDINWLMTGGFYATPNGYWVEEAASHPDICTDPSNIVMQPIRHNRGAVYSAAFSMAYTVDPPAKRIEGTDSFSCVPDGDDKDCKLTTPGHYEIRFVFDTTPGNLWGVTAQGGQCAQTPILPMGSSNPSFPVPTQTITFPINVVLGTETPNAPAVEPAVSGGSCTVGQPHTISFSSTDPDGDNLRYGVDWDSDGSVDQWVPPSGHVPSGTSQSASRTYSTSGSKTVKVLAQDEGGLTSSFSTLTFTCAQVQPQEQGSGTGGIYDPGGGGGNEGNAPPPAATLSLTAIPSLVRSGNTTRVNWSTSNVSSCTVTAPNGDSWSGLQSPLGGHTSTPITEETTYTLTCLDLNGGTQTKQATVRIIPVFQEQ